ncbi:RrF2 family transcriptional regulator [Alkalimarinus alittae]|uniref:Rrf2 family transcriptional regulator n=1 Tax=Alkalimarinus alittae TaxID=2961619 RepID=A0ABY6N6Y4_9ALTE|nr:Rrf2 family transcriptional regulator [Alkalimarinus alittae]UZE97785.1 Rrf2 family transcriptional regulator [Alkalimarinus alittae]
MQITRFTDYSLRTLMYLNTHSTRLCTVKEVAEYHNISQNHLVKVVHNLSRLGYIKSTKGKNGGIRLTENTDKTRLGDLIMQFEPTMNTAECFDPESNTCNLTVSCQLKHYLQEAMQNFINTMNQYTLANTTQNRIPMREQRGDG